MLRAVCGLDVFGVLHTTLSQPLLPPCSVMRLVVGGELIFLTLELELGVSIRFATRPTVAPKYGVAFT